MCKILPRIEGDFDKLAIHREAGEEQVTILAELKSLLSKRLSSIWDGTERPDLYRQFIGIESIKENKGDSSPTETNSILIPCRSKNKISWMENRLTNTSFTSYWP